ncbi:MAG: hypothetical protein V1863_05170 [Candidatus Omnitrophota bacterium]
MKRCLKCKIPLEGSVAKVLKTILKITPSDKNPELCNRCAKDQNAKTYMCQICNRAIEEHMALTHIKAEEYLLALIKKDHPEWHKGKETCPECLDYYRDLVKKAQI